MSLGGLDALFNPSKRHLDEEKLRLQSTREEVGDASGGKRIDLDSGKVRIRKRSVAKVAGAVVDVDVDEAVDVAEVEAVDEAVDEAEVEEAPDAVDAAETVADVEPAGQFVDVEPAEQFVDVEPAEQFADVEPAAPAPDARASGDERDGDGAPA